MNASGILFQVDSLSSGKSQIQLVTVKMGDMTAPPPSKKVKVKVKPDRPLVADCIISHKPLTSNMLGPRTRAESEP